MPRPALGPMSGRAIRRPTPDQVKRFWARVRKGDGCWEWLGAKNFGGYGTMSLPDQHRGPLGAHRISFAIAHGQAPAGLVVMHSCDNPPCVNPAHLRAGTQGENYREAMERGRRKFQRATTCRICGDPRDKATSMALCRPHRLEAIRAYQERGRVQRTIQARHQRLPDGLPDTLEALVDLVGERRAVMLARNFGLYHFRAPERAARIADDYGVTRERVRQLIGAACVRLGTTPRTFWGRNQRKAG